MGNWDKFNKFVYVILKLAYINVLWILFSILGLVAFGIFPATAAMFGVVHKLIRNEDNLKIFTTFWNLFRTDFLRMNALGIIFLTIAYFLYFDFTFLKLNSGKLQILYPALIFIFIASLITFLFFFPVFSHFKLKFFQYFKQSFLIAITSPAEVFLIILSASAIYIAVTILPGIIPLFTGSVFAYLSTLIGFRAFEKIEKRKGINV